MLIHTFDIWIWFLNWCYWWGTRYIGRTGSALSSWGSCRSSCRRFLKKRKKKKKYQYHTDQRTNWMNWLHKLNATLKRNFHIANVLYTPEGINKQSQHRLFWVCASTKGKNESVYEIFSSIIIRYFCSHS